MSDDTKPGERAPKVRTSHHRNREEATRLQALVDKRLKRNNDAPIADAMSDEEARSKAIEECALLMERWANDATDFVDPKSIVYRNTCLSAVKAIRNLKRLMQ